MAAARQMKHKVFVSEDVQAARRCVTQSQWNVFMPTTIEEIESFTAFARKSALREDGPSLEECLRLWREEQELAETIEDIKRGVADIEAGRYMTLEEADRQIRASLGWPPPKS